MGEITAAAPRYRLDRLLSAHLHPDGLLGPEVHFWQGRHPGASVRLQWAEWLVQVRLHVEELRAEADKARGTED